MIYTTLEGLRTYHSVLPEVEEVLTFARQAADLPAGRYDLPHGAYAMIKDGTTKEAPSGRFEAHVQYIDIHFLLQGSERIYWRSIEGMHLCQPYCPEKDNVFYDGKAGLPLDMAPGELLVCFPDDGHSANNSLCMPVPYRKVVFKLPVKEEMK